MGFGDFKEFGQNDEIISRIIEQRQISPNCRDDVGSIGTIGELEGTLDELKKVQEVLQVDDADVILGADFTDSRVKESDLANYRVLHFATHGVLGISAECLPEPGLITSIAEDSDWRNSVATD